MSKLAPAAEGIDASGEVPGEKWKAMSEQGLAGVTVPVEAGGAGHPWPVLVRTVECLAGGCAACGTALMREDFVGAVGLNQVTRFQLDPRDERDDADFYQLVGDDSGVFGCMTLLGCEDMCPKDLPLATQIAFLRRRMVAANFA